MCGTCPAKKQQLKGRQAKPMKSTKKKQKKSAPMKQQQCVDAAK
jgi:hypothetical protein